MLSMADNFQNMLVILVQGGRALRKQREAEERLTPYIGRVDPGKIQQQKKAICVCMPVMKRSCKAKNNQASIIFPLPGIHVINM